jgi:antitoxin component of MazEF toxin-antitoxin module
LTAIAGTPVERVVALVRPLVPRDNEWSLRARLPAYAVGAEVLQGLGLTQGGAVRFEVEGGRSAVLQPIPVAEWAALLGYESQLARPTGAQPLWLTDLGSTQTIRTIYRGRAVYLGYRETTEPTGPTADRLARLAARPGIRRLVVDLRLNGGGDNHTYGPLLDLLRDPAVGRKTVVLLGRSTFSAATNFVTEVDRYTRARLLGEPSGGSPNLWGDAQVVELPRSGLTVRIATRYWEFALRADKRLAVAPDVPVALTAADFFAGRDPVLARALR